MKDLLKLGIEPLDESSIDKIVEIDYNSKLDIEEWTTDQLLETIDTPNVYGKIIFRDIPQDSIAYWIAREYVNEYAVIRYNSIHAEELNLLKGIIGYYKFKMIYLGTKLTILVDEHKTKLCKELGALNSTSESIDNKIKFTFFKDTFGLWVYEALNTEKQLW